MTHNQNILTTGTIIEQYSQKLYRVKLDNGTEIPCWVVNRFRVVSGKKRKRPKIILNDRVKVEISLKDFSKGELVGFAN